MDTFMDKLAQKLNAQEMIKANSAADAEEMDQLKNQLREYDECLAQMQQANKELRAVNHAMETLMSETIAPEVTKLSEESVAAIRKMQQENTEKLQELQQLGLGYLTLGEETPSLSGGEAQRLKLASEIGRIQTDSVFVFDEPSIGLHPLDVRVLLGVFQALLDRGATVVVIEHDLDVIRSADYVIDMGPGGGDAGGRIVAAGTPEEIRQDPGSVTGRYL